jgi:antitoxin component of MazEF toxin-antitoxin module
MVQIETKVKRWGNSFGVIIPSETITAKKIKENQKINIIILEDSKKVLEETFGIGKGKIKKTAQEMKDEARRELYG